MAPSSPISFQHIPCGNSRYNPCIFGSDDFSDSTYSASEGSTIPPRSDGDGDGDRYDSELMFPLSLDIPLVLKSEIISPQGGAPSGPDLTSPQGSVPSGNDLLPSSPLNYEQMFPMPLEDPPAKGSKGSVPRIRDQRERCMFPFDDIPSSNSDSGSGSEPDHTSSLPPTPEEDKIACYFKRPSFQAVVPSRPDLTSPTGANQTGANQRRKRVSFLTQEFEAVTMATQKYQPISLLTQQIKAETYATQSLLTQLLTSESQKRQTGG